MGLLAGQSHSMAGSISQTQTGFSGERRNNNISVLSGKGRGSRNWLWQELEIGQNVQNTLYGILKKIES